MGKRVRKAAYVVFRGRQPGIYRTWNECDAQVKGFADCKHKSYEIFEEAERAWAAWEEEQLTAAEALIAARKPLQHLQANWPIRHGMCS